MKYSMLIGTLIVALFMAVGCGKGVRFNPQTGQVEPIAEEVVEARTAVEDVEPSNDFGSVDGEDEEIVEAEE